MSECALVLSDILIAVLTQPLVSLQRRWHRLELWRPHVCAAGEGGRVTALIVVMFRRGRRTIRVTTTPMQGRLPAEETQ